MIKNKFYSVCLIFISLLFFSQPAIADEWHILEDGRRYLYDFKYYYGEPYGIIHKIDGTMEYDGKLYSKLYYTWYKQESNDCEWDLIGLLREEDGKYFLFTPPEVCTGTGVKHSDGFFADKEEVMIFDVNMQPGERYNMKFWFAESRYSSSGPPDEYGLHDDITVEVRGNEIKEFDGKPRRVLSLQQIKWEDYETGNLNIIEGIGPDKGSLIGPGFPFKASRIPTQHEPYEVNGIYNKDDEFIFLNTFLGEEDEEGEEAMKILAEGLDFEYTKLKSPDGKPIHYRINGTTIIYDKEYFNVWRYKDEWDPKTAELMAFMRENNGRLYSRYWDVDRYRSVAETSEVSNYSLYGDGIACDFNKQPGDVIYTSRYSNEIVNSVDVIFVNGEPRKRFITENNVYVEGLGLINGGVLPFLASSYAISAYGGCELKYIRDAEGNVIFSRDQLSGIDDVRIGEERQTETEYYDLTGRRVSAPVKGIYIVKDSAGVRKAVF